MSSVETGQMSAVETGQMTAAETSVLSQQRKAQVQSWLTKVPSPKTSKKRGGPLLRPVSVGHNLPPTRTHPSS